MDLAGTPEIAEAERQLQRLREAWAVERGGLEAELTLDPELQLLARDDPPRPAQLTPGAVAGAEVRWSPLRSQVLLAEARVLEACAGLIAARREAGYRALRAPVEAARAARALREARVDLGEARATERRLRGRAAPTDAQGREALARERLAAELDAREARLEVAERARTLAGWRAEAAALGADTPSPPALPRPLLPPEALPVADSLTFRARALREEASVALARRRATAAVLGGVALEGAYHGSDARLQAGVELASGRPRARAALTLRGTPQERWELGLSARLRMGSDAPRAWRTLEAARADRARTLSGLRAEIVDDRREARAEVRARAARLELAGARWSAARAADDPEAADDALDRLQRAWLRWLRSVDRLLRSSEGDWRLP